MADCSAATLAAEFRRHFGPAPSRPLGGIARAPGRVNLIGEHTDYNGGWVLPMAIDRSIALCFAPNEDDTVELASLDYGQRASFRLGDLRRPRPLGGAGWLDYPKGVVWSLQQAGYELRGMRAVVAGDVPVGAGLSSSAAFEVAAALAFCAVSGLKIEPLALAQLCQRAENEFVGMRCGIMDQYVALHAREGCALLIDCQTLEHHAVPLPRGGASILVCDTGVKHELVSTEYNLRRSECEQAVAILAGREASVKSFRDIRPQHLERHRAALGDRLLRRVRHVISENQRVMDSVAALECGDAETFGRLINESHESLRRDYEASCPELDTMVELARSQPGTLGARMVGGGFGGCTVNLVRPEALERVRAAVAQGYERAVGRSPATYVFRPACAAHIEELPP